MDYCSCALDFSARVQLLFTADSFLYGHVTFLVSLVKSNVYVASFVCPMYLRKGQSTFSSPAAIQSPGPDHSPLLDLVYNS